MKTRPFWAGLLCLAACASTPDDTEIEVSAPDTEERDTEADTDTDTSDIDGDCAWEASDLRWAYPANDADNIWISPEFDTVTVNVGALTGDAVGSVQTTDGAEVAGSSSVSGDVLTWTPTSGGLADSTTYEFIVTAQSCSHVASRFTTIDPSPATLPVDAVYTLDFSHADGATSLLTDLLFNDETSIALWQSSEGRFEVVPVSDGEHEQCLSTAGAESNYSAPMLSLSEFTVGIGDPSAPILFIESDIRAVTDSGDASTFVNVHLNGFLDFSALEEDDLDFCELVTTFNLACEPCPDFAANDCLPVELVNVTGTLAPNFVIVEEPTPGECSSVE